MSDIEKLEAYVGKKKRRTGLRVFRVVLTEKYEVNIAGYSKEDAKERIVEFGGKEPFQRSEVVYETDFPLDVADNWAGDRLEEKP
jgi:hypothetical protein